MTICIKKIGYTLLLVISSLPYLAFSQVEPSTFEGQLIDSINQYYIYNAKIEIIGGYQVIKETTSDSFGRYSIDGLTYGKKEIKIHKNGYASIHLVVLLEEGANRFNVYMHPKHFDLAPSEIISNKDNHLSTISSNAKVLSATTIELQNRMSIQDALASVSGISAFSDGGIGSSRINIGVRGLDPRQSQRVVLLEDGLPLQTSPYLMSLGTFNTPPVERIKSIEILKSASALRYGAQSIGGVINFITQTPRQAMGGKIRLQGGMNGFASALAEIGGFGTEKIRPEFQFLYKRGDGYKSHNTFSQVNGNARLAYVPTPKNRLDFKIHGNFEDANTTYTGLTEYSYRTNPRFNAKKSDTLSNWNIGFNLTYQHEIAKQVDSETKLYFNYTNFGWWQEDNIFISEADYLANNLKEQSIENSYAIQDLIRVGNGVSNRSNLQQVYTGGLEQSFVWNHNISKTVDGKLNVGIHFHLENINQQEKKGNAPNDYEGVFYEFDSATQQKVQVGNHYHLETYAFSLFAIEKITLGKLSLHGGFRLEAFNLEQVDLLSVNRDRKSNAFFTLLPGVGFNYAFKALDIFGGAHRAFSPPSIRTLRATDFGNPTNTQYQDLASLVSSSWNFELGCRSFSKYLAVESTAFLLLIDDLVSTGFKSSFTNKNQVVTTGIETEFTIKTSQLWKHLPNIQLNYTYLRTAILSGKLNRSALSLNTTPDVAGNELPYAPQHTFSIAATYHSYFGLSAFVEYRYVGRSYSDYENINYIFNRGDTGPIPAYWLLNASISYQYKHFLRFFVSGENLLDKVYISSRLHSHPAHPSATSSSGILVGNRLQIVGGVEYKF
ncbi:TonB-dependent receptor domain-containing protein [Aureispira anguillae]|uniref:TonB-dependent receptor n=1 Tax=Aureispira anguillae TaxID=2864201 RepID=A0A916DP76_9BACT|nr:TonB-dependent receptor [Aureispira anguillae]BDS10359.1 TonB-dependent receptor [Aureispira anguillae]